MIISLLNLTIMEIQLAFPGLSTCSGSLAEQGLNNQRGNKGDSTRNGDTVILNILGHLAPNVNAEEGVQCLAKGENMVDSVVRRLQGQNNEGNKDKHCQGKKKGGKGGVKARKTYITSCFSSTTS